MDQAKGFADQPGERPGDGPSAGQDDVESIGGASVDDASLDDTSPAAAPTPWDGTGLDDPPEDAAPEPEGDGYGIQPGALAGFSLVLDSSAASEADAEAEAALAEDLDLPEVPAGDGAGAGESPTLTLLSESWLSRTERAADILDDEKGEDLLQDAAASAAGTGSGLRELLRSRAELSRRPAA